MLNILKPNGTIHINIIVIYRDIIHRNQPCYEIKIIHLSEGLESSPLPLPKQDVKEMKQKGYGIIYA